MLRRLPASGYSVHMQAVSACLLVYVRITKYSRWDRRVERGQMDVGAHARAHDAIRGGFV